MTEDNRKHLRKPDSRWAVAYPGKTVPWIVRGWFRWYLLAVWHRDFLSRYSDLPFSVESAETIDRDWEIYDKRYETFRPYFTRGFD